MTDLEVYEAEPPRQVARLPDIDASEPVIVRSRRYLVDGVPVQAAMSYLLAEPVRGSAIAEPDTGPGGTPARLADLGLAPVRFTEERRARMPRRQEKELLALAEATPVVEICRTAFTEEGRPVEVTVMLLDGSAYVMEYNLES